MAGAKRAMLGDVGEEEALAETVSGPFQIGGGDHVAEDRRPSRPIQTGEMRMVSMLKRPGSE